MSKSTKPSITKAMIRRSVASSSAIETGRSVSSIEKRLAGKRVAKSGLAL
jgi:hypothetical protein